MMTENHTLYTLYAKLREFLPSISPMLIRNYDDEYILAHIIYNDDDINTLKILYDVETESFYTKVSNFKNGYHKTIIGDPFKSVEKLFVEYSRLDGLSIQALNYAVCRTINIYTSYTDTYIRYNIRDYIITIDIIDDKFELTLSKGDYTSKVYSFTNGYEVYRFITYFVLQYVKMYFDESNDMMLDLILDLYIEFGYRNVFISPNEDMKSDTSIRLITPYGDMYFSYHEDRILCEYYHELDGKRTYYSKTVDTCKEALDYAYCL